MMKQIGTSFLVGAMAPFLAAATGIAPVPDAWWWFPYVITAGAGIAAALIQLAGHVFTGRKRARADFDDEKAKRMLADNDPTNDDKAEALALEAKLIRADAEAIDTTVNAASARLHK